MWPVGWEESRSAAHFSPCALRRTFSTPSGQQGSNCIHTSRSLPSNRPVTRGAVSFCPAAPALIGCTHQHQLNKSGGPGGRQGQNAFAIHAGVLVHRPSPKGSASLVHRSFPGSGPHRMHTPAQLDRSSGPRGRQSPTTFQRPMRGTSSTSSRTGASQTSEKMPGESEIDCFSKTLRFFLTFL